MFLDYPLLISEYYCDVGEYLVRHLHSPEIQCAITAWESLYCCQRWPFGCVAFDSSNVKMQWFNVVIHNSAGISI